MQCLKQTEPGPDDSDPDDFAPELDRLPELLYFFVELSFAVFTSSPFPGTGQATFT